MRPALTVLLWLVATASLAVAVPAMWAQQHLVDVDGYAALARSAAHDPELQRAVAAELTTQVVGRSAVDRSQVAAAAAAYTQSSAFPRQFGQVNRIAHAWLFTDSARRSGRVWRLDIAPMLSETGLAQTLDAYGVEAPASVTVPVTATGGIRPGQLRPVATWAGWVSLAAAGLAGAAALLTLLVARRRGKVLAALGLSALLVGGAGWAAAEVVKPYIADALGNVTGGVRDIAEVMVTHAEAGLHQWLNLTLAAGGVLIVLGVLAAIVGSWVRDR